MSSETQKTCPSASDFLQSAAIERNSAMIPQTFKLAGLILVVTSAAPAWAVTYSYTGKPMENFTGDRWPTGTIITGTIEATEKLTGRTTLALDPKITSFAFSAGLATIDSAGDYAGTRNPSYIETDESGERVLFWDISVRIFSGGGNFRSTFDIDSINVLNGAVGDEVFSGTTGPTSSTASGARNSEAGTWAVSTTPAPIPLPASLPLLGAALAGLFGAVRSRRRTS